MTPCCLFLRLNCMLKMTHSLVPVWQRKSLLGLAPAGTPISRASQLPGPTQTPIRNCLPSAWKDYVTEWAPIPIAGGYYGRYKRNVKVRENQIPNSCTLQLGSTPWLANSRVTQIGGLGVSIASSGFCFDPSLLSLSHCEASRGPQQSFIARLPWHPVVSDAAGWAQHDVLLPLL